MHTCSMRAEKENLWELAKTINSVGVNFGWLQEATDRGKEFRAFLKAVYSSCSRTSQHFSKNNIPLAPDPIR